MSYGAKDVLNIMHTMAEIDTYTMMLVNASNRKYVGLFKQELENTINKMRGKETMKSLSIEEINKLQSENEKLNAENKILKEIYCIGYEKDCYKKCKQENCKIKNCYIAEGKLKKIKDVITNFSKTDIVTLPDLKQEHNYKMIAKQYAQPIKEILQIIKGE